MSTQKAWDESLIAAWRADGLVLYAINEWERITGLQFKEHQGSLLRAPHIGYPFKTRARVFVAQYLDKINNRLWDQSPERDAALVAKLQTSTFTTSRSLPSEATRELHKEQRQLRSNRAKMALSSHNYSERNHATDGGVVKSSRVRIRSVR